MRLAPSQIALIHVAKKQLGMTDEDYRAMLQSVAGVASSKNLSHADFERVMENFVRLGFKNPRRYGERRGMASARQLDYIRRLWLEFSGTDDDAALGRFIAGKWKVAHLRFVSAELAPKIIAGLKNMGERPQSAKKKAESVKTD